MRIHNTGLMTTSLSSKAHLEGEVCLAAGPLAVEDGGVILAQLRAHLRILI